MLLAGGDEPATALTGLKNITIVSAVPFVIVMLLLCVALWKDLAKDPLVIRGNLAQHVLSESVSYGVQAHAGEAFQLSTIVDVVTVEAAEAAEASEAAEAEQGSDDPYTPAASGTSSA